MDFLAGRYRNKIKTAEEIARLVGERPRRCQVVMCHGVFDVVHPAHMSHMIYAKTKADILVASLTADRNVTKCQYRPHVPEGIRAANLAAYEFVDYVVIDEDPVPLKNIGVIKPDYFAKGFEYSTVPKFSKTEKELEVLRSYGGEIIFTPGDFVLSSSRLIEASPPNLRIEKLSFLMGDSGIGFDHLRSTLDKLASFHVHVIGDTIVDSITRANTIGGQTKTPTISVQFESRTDYVGGAAVVARHLRAAGASVTFSTVVGPDGFADFALQTLDKDGIVCGVIIEDQTRPTTHKNVIVASDHRLLKIDTLDNQPISDTILSELEGAISKTDADAVVFSDFRHGIFNKRTIPVLTAAIPQKAYKVADSQVASRWGNIVDFQDFDLITPNEREARFALGNAAGQDLGIRPLATAVQEGAQAKLMIMKLGDKGILTCYDGRFFVIDSFANRVVDAVGAGDALLAYSTLGMLASKSQVISSILGTFAAACECERDGNIPITVDDVHQKIDLVERESKYS